MRQIREEEERLRRRREEERIQQKREEERGKEKEVRQKRAEERYQQSTKEEERTQQRREEKGNRIQDRSNIRAALKEEGRRLIKAVTHKTMVSINTLPEEMLERVFHLLPPRDLKAVVLVCRWWREVGEAP